MKNQAKPAGNLLFFFGQDWSTHFAWNSYTGQGWDGKDT
jgi:hypothetical protein